MCLVEVLDEEYFIKKNKNGGTTLECKGEYGFNLVLNESYSESQIKEIIAIARRFYDRGNDDGNRHLSARIMDAIDGF